MNAQTSRLAARGFVEVNLELLAADVIVWRRDAKLPPGSKFHQLAKLCGGFAEPGDLYQTAERLVSQLALEHVAAPAPAPAQLGANPSGMVSEVGGKFSQDAEACNRLLPKLAELADTVDDMTDDEYGEWINALPVDEFLEFIALNLEEPALRKAVAQARARKYIEGRVYIDIRPNLIEIKDGERFEGSFSSASDGFLADTDQFKADLNGVIDRYFANPATLQLPDNSAHLRLFPGSLEITEKEMAVITTSMDTMFIDPVIEVVTG